MKFVPFIFGALLLTAGCASLTHPDEITIAAEPLPTAAAPQQAPPAMAVPARGQGAQQASPGTG